MGPSNNPKSNSTFQAFERRQKELESTIRFLSKNVMRQSDDLAILEEFTVLRHGEEFRKFRFQRMNDPAGLGAEDVKFKQVKPKVVIGVGCQTMIKPLFKPKEENETELDIDVEIVDEDVKCPKQEDVKGFRLGRVNDWLEGEGTEQEVCSQGRQGGLMGSWKSLSYDVIDVDVSIHEDEEDEEYEAKISRSGTSKWNVMDVDNCDSEIVDRIHLKDDAKIKGEYELEEGPLNLVIGNYRTLTKPSKNHNKNSSRKLSSIAQTIGAMPRNVASPRKKAVKSGKTIPALPATVFKRPLGRPKRGDTQDTRERRYVCEFCENRYLSNAGLREHKRRIHLLEQLDHLGKRMTDQKPSFPNYECPLCNQTFKGSQLLDKHKDQCGFKSLKMKKVEPRVSKNKVPLATPSSINKSPSYPWVCPHCGKLFVRQANVNRHIKSNCIVLNGMKSNDLCDLKVNNLKQ